MDWIREYWVGAVVLLAIVASFFVSQADYAARDARARVDQVAACERASARNALVAAYQRRTADARRQAGDELVARDYEGFAESTVAFIPRTEFSDPSKLVEVDRFIDDVGHVQYRLTPTAKKLQHEGCEASYRR